MTLFQYTQALRLICELCLYYHIRDPTLWASLLEQLLSLEMVRKIAFTLSVFVSQVCSRTGKCLGGGIILKNVKVGGGGGQKHPLLPLN